MRQSANTNEVLSSDFFNDAENEPWELPGSTRLGVTSMHINGYWVREQLTHLRGSKIFVMSQSPRKTWDKPCVKLSSISIRSFTAYLLLISLCSNYLEIKSLPSCGILANSFPLPFSSTVRQRQCTTALRTMRIKCGERGHAEYQKDHYLYSPSRHSEASWIWTARVNTGHIEPNA